MADRVMLPDGTMIDVEIADTAGARERGLMGRTSLAAGTGMLFVFDAPGFYPFWMKDTLVALDILWLDRHGRIVTLRRDAPPCAAEPCPMYAPRRDALYVLEVAAGTCAAHGVREGDVLRIDARQGM